MAKNQPALNMETPPETTCVVGVYTAAGGIEITGANSSGLGKKHGRLGHETHLPGLALLVSSRLASEVFLYGFDSLLISSFEESPHRL